MRRLSTTALFAVALVSFAAIQLDEVRADSVTYEHDTKGRLTKATFGDGTVVDYTYDTHGNRLTAAVTAPPPDSPPSAPGTPTFANVAGTSATANWTAATDNIGVAGYDYRLNAGAWQSLGNVLTVNLTGLTPATAYTLDVRARDTIGQTGQRR